MQNIILFLKRKSIAQTIIQKMQNKTDVSVTFESDYKNADIAVSRTAADAALIEATENKDEDILFCLHVCAMLCREHPACKVLLLCPESNADNIAKAVEAKQNGLIEDFVFYDMSVDYIVSKLLSM